MDSKIKRWCDAGKKTKKKTSKAKSDRSFKTFLWKDTVQQLTTWQTQGDIKPTDLH